MLASLRAAWPPPARACGGRPQLLSFLRDTRPAPCTVHGRSRPTRGRLSHRDVASAGIGAAGRDCHVRAVAAWGIAGGAGVDVIEAAMLMRVTQQPDRRGICCCAQQRVRHVRTRTLAPACVLAGAMRVSAAPPGCDWHSLVLTCFLGCSSAAVFALTDTSSAASVTDAHAVVVLFTWALPGPSCPWCCSCAWPLLTWHPWLPGEPAHGAATHYDDDAAAATRRPPWLGCHNPSSGGSAP